MIEISKIPDGYYLIFLCFDETYIRENGKIVGYCKLHEASNQHERLDLAIKNNINPIWDYYIMANISGGEIKQINATPCVIGMGKESDRFVNFTINNFNIISYHKII